MGAPHCEQNLALPQLLPHAVQKTITAEAVGGEPVYTEERGGAVNVRLTTIQWEKATLQKKAVSSS